MSWCGGHERHGLNSMIKSKNILWILKITYSTINNWNWLCTQILHSLDTHYNANHVIIHCTSSSGLSMRKFNNIIKIASLNTTQIVDPFVYMTNCNTVCVFNKMILSGVTPQVA
jgi:hypothetical protein